MCENLVGFASVLAVLAGFLLALRTFRLRETLEYERIKAQNATERYKSRMSVRKYAIQEGAAFRGREDEGDEEIEEDEEDAPELPPFVAGIVNGAGLDAGKIARWDQGEILRLVAGIQSGKIALPGAGGAVKATGAGFYG